MYEDALHVTRALQAGAKGYVTKRETMDLLAHAIRECLAGRTYVSPRAASGLSEAR
jgi:DNA-binding NarL/FixJ family response regulator